MNTLRSSSAKLKKLVLDIETDLSRSATSEARKHRVYISFFFGQTVSLNPSVVIQQSCV